MTNGQLPPGPSAPAAVQTLAWWSRPIPFLERCRARYGKAFTVRVVAQEPIVMISDPAELKQLFTAPSDLLHPGEGASLVEPIVGPNSILLLDEDRHLEKRKLVLPAFHGSRIAAFQDVMNDVAEEEIASWPVDEPTEMHPRVLALTLEVILRAVFGLERGSERLRTLRGLLSEWGDFGASPLSLIPPLQREGAKRGPVARFMEIRRQTDEQIYALIGERREAGEVGDDALAMLLSARHEDGSPVSDGEVRDDLLALLVAGYETTATELAWCLERLAHNPRVRSRLVAEIDAGRDEYLTATIRETLRARPVLINAQPRKVVGNIQIGEYTYGPGCQLLASAYLVHHDPEIYPNPEEFRPERFLDTEPGTYTWIPFGGGVRRCLGASFAMLEMKTVLRTLLSRCEVLAARDAPELNKRRMIAVIPSAGAKVLLRPRVAAEPQPAPDAPAPATASEREEAAEPAMAMAAATTAAAAEPVEPNLPPGPRTPGLWQMRQWFSDPVAFMERNRERYGRTFTVKLGALKRCAFIGDPEAAWKVLSGDPGSFRMGPTNALFRPVLGERSLFLLDGEEHRHHRRLLAPAFHRGAVRGYAGLIEEITARDMTSWPTGTPFQLQAAMRRITTESIVRIVVGVCTPERDDEIRRLVPEMLEIAENPLALMPQFQRELGGRSPFGRVMNVTRQIDALLFDEIGLRRTLTSSERGSDVLSALAAPQPHEDAFMTDREIRDEMLTLLIAGHETTANALSWAFERLLRHPDALERLLEEPEGEDAYLDAVVRETLRQRPILPITARRLTVAARVGEFAFPRGWTLMPCIYLIHRDPEAFPDPDRFLPERYLQRPAPELSGLAPVRRRQPPLHRQPPGDADDQDRAPDRGLARPPRGRRGARADRPQQHDAGARTRGDGHGAAPAACTHARRAAGAPLSVSSEIFAPSLLSGQVCVVSGGGTGLGRAISLELAGLGATVVACGRRIEPLEGTRSEIEAAGGSADASTVDIRDEASVEELVGGVVERHGRIDLLVNNAGGQFMAPAEGTSPNGFRSVVELNLNGTWNMTRAAATAAFIPQESGKVVSVTLSPHTGAPGVVHSSAARAGVENMTRTLSVEWARFGIRLCALAPGQIDTEAFRTNYPAIIDQVARTIPLGRLGRPEEVAWAVAYLASPAGDFFSGAVLTMDGGRDNWFGAWPPALDAG